MNLHVCLVKQAFNMLKTPTAKSNKSFFVTATTFVCNNLRLQLRLESISVYRTSYDVIRQQIKFRPTMDHRACCLPAVVMSRDKS
eukprot:4535776-Pleurochrysis_carterae.AAC.2